MMRMVNNLRAAGRAGTIISSPSDISGLVAQWKADSLALADTNPIVNWADSSGNGRTASAVGGQQALYRTNQFGTVPGAQFDAVDDWYGFTATPSQVSISVIVVMKAAPATEHWLLYNFGDSGQTRVGVTGAGTNTFRIQDPSLGAVSSAFSSMAGAFMASLSLQQGGNINFYENITARGSSAWVNNNNMVFDKISVATTAAIGTVVGELCIYNRALSAGEITDLYNSYFKPKFGLP